MTSPLNWGRVWCLALLLAVVGVLIGPQSSPAQADPKTTCDSVKGEARKFCHDEPSETERCKVLKARLSSTVSHRASPHKRAPRGRARCSRVSRKSCARTALRTFLACPAVGAETEAEAG